MDTKGFQYGLHSIKKLTSYLNSPDALGLQNLNEEKIGVGRRFQLGFNYETGILTIKVVIDFLCRTESPEPLNLFGTAVQCEFKFLGFEEVLKKNEKGQADIPDDLLITLFSVSYSSIRGILVAQTAGTDYSNYLLPLIETSEFRTMLKKITGEAKEEKIDITI